MRRYLLAINCLVLFSCKQKDTPTIDHKNLLVALTQSTSLQDPLFTWYHLVQTWFARHAIAYPLNLEYSVKISRDVIDRKRYVIQIPKAYMRDHAWFEELFDELKFPTKARAAMDAWISNDSWKNILLAVDGGHGLTYKTYVGYGHHEKPGTTIIDSVEFNEQGETQQRTYTRVSIHECFQYIEHLPAAQQQAVRQLIPWLEFRQALRKQASGKQSLCIKCKNNTRVAIIKPFLRALAATITSEMDDVDNLLRTANDFFVSWVHLTPHETSWYFRSQRWFTPKIKPSRQGS